MGKIFRKFSKFVSQIILPVTKRIYFFLFSLLSIYPSIEGQKIIRGNVKNINGIAIEYANITIIESDIILVQCMSDSLGEWQAILKNEMIYFDIFIQQISCKDTLIRMSQLNSEDYIINIVLNCENNIEQIEINASRIGMIVNADTLSFDISFFKDGSEKNLGDMLSKLPGLNILDDGQIYYNGRRIDKLLIEGKDIMNGQHKLANEGFNINDIKGIQIIEQYKSFSQRIFGGYSEQVALNVQLNDEAKSELKGNANIEFGFKNKLGTKTSLFNVGSKSAYTHFLRANNFGQAIISATDYLAMQSNIQRILSDNKKTLEEIIPNGFSIPLDLKTNKDFLIASNGEIKSNDKVTNRYSFFATTLNRISSSNNIKTFYPEGSNLITEQSRKSKQYLGNCQVNSQIKLNDKINLEIDIPFHFKKPFEGINSVSNFSQNKFTSLFDFSATEWNLNPQIYSTFSLNKKITIKLQYYFQANKSVLDKTFMDNDSILSTFFFNTIQNSVNTILQHRASAQLIYISDFVEYGIENSIFINNDNIGYRNTPSLNQLIEGASILKERIFQINAFLGLKYKKLLISPTLSFPAQIFRNLNGLMHEQNILNPSFLIKYKYGKINFILFQYGQGYKLSDHNLMNGFHSIQANRNISLNEILPNQTAYSLSYSISHLWLSTSSKSRIYTRFSSTKMESPVITSFKNLNDYVLTSSVVAKSVQNLNFLNTFQYKLKKIPISINISLLLSNATSIFFDRPDTKFHTANFSFGISTNFKIPFKVETSFSQSSNDLSLVGITSNKFNIKNYNLLLTYFKNKWLIESNFSLVENFNNSIKNNTFIKLDAKIEFEINDRYKLYFNGSDLLNLNGVENTSASYTEFYSEFTTLRRYPGYLNFGLQYSL